jgi:hypothetical protein
VSVDKRLNLRSHAAHVGRAVLAAVIVLAAATLAVSCGSGEQTATPDESPSSVVVDLPKAGVPHVLCKDEAIEDLAVPTGIEVLVTNLMRQASLADAAPYEDFVLRCDNTGVTAIEAPTAYRDVDPSPLAQPQTAVRVATDLSAPIEAAPIINFFAATVGGAQFPTRPGFAALIQQSADGSLSSGTRDPREGTTIADDCQALPIRDLATEEFTGKAQFFVNCGGEQRAWVLVAAAPKSGAPYFVQMVAPARDGADADAIGRALTTMSVDAEALAAFNASLEAAAPQAPPTPSTQPTSGAPATTTAP